MLLKKSKGKLKKNSRNEWQWKHNNPKPMGCSKSSSKREVYRHTILRKKQEKQRIDNIILHIKQLKKEQQQQQNNPKIIRRKEIIKIWAELNENDMKEEIVNINKTKNWFFENINKIDKSLVRLIKEKREESNQQN